MKDAWIVGPGKPWAGHCHRRWQSFFVIIGLLSVFGGAWSAWGEDIRFEHLTGKQGLSQSLVFAILQDSKGFMWFGTWGGLNRFDGQTITRYEHDPSDPTSISGNTVVALAEDNSGLLWVGTDAGLNRFDPVTETFTRYRASDDPQSLASDLVPMVHQDRHGSIWVQAYIGLTHAVYHILDPQSGTFTRFMHNPDDPDSISGNRLGRFFHDPSGTVWIAPAGAGLNRYKQTTGTFTRYTHDPKDKLSLSDAKVTCIFANDRQSLWVGTETGGLNKLDLASETFTNYRYHPEDPASLSCDHITELFADREGKLWIATWGGGLCRFDATLGTFTRFRHDPDDPYSLSSNFVPGPFTARTSRLGNPFLEDQEDRLWVFTMLDRDTPNGIDRFDPQTQRFTHNAHRPDDPHSLGSDHILGTYQDRSGTIWLATSGHGLSRFSYARAKFRAFSHHPQNPNSLSGNLVQSILEDSSGAVWIGTKNGIDRLDPSSGRFSHHRSDAQRATTLLGNTVVSIIQDQAGRIWAGTNGGLNQLDGKSGEVVARYPFVEDNLGPHIPDAPLVFEDSLGKLWLASAAHGLATFDPKTGRFKKDYRHHPDDPSSLSSNLVTSLAEAPSGEIWVTTWDGLNRIDQKTAKITRYLHDPEDNQTLSGSHISCIYIDPAGIVWVGTWTGLNRLDPATGRVANFTARDGLANDAVYGILSDEAGNLWLSTNNGLSRFNPDSGTFRNYDTDDGLPSNEFTTRACHRGSTGTLYFGGIKGLVFFDPAEIRDSTYSPQVVLTGFTVFEEPVVLESAISVVDEILLSYRQSSFSFEFAALDYSSPEKIRYAYKLEGFDDDWRHCGNRRSATFSPGPGKYLFRVRATNSDGMWSDNELAVSLAITPPLWQQWWAYWVYGLMLAGLVFAFLRLQTGRLERERQISQRLREADSLKDQIIASTSHELRTPLNGIIGLAESLIDGATGQLGAATRSNLLMIASSARRLGAMVNDILDFARIRRKKLTLRTIPVDLHVLVNEVLTLSEPLLVGKDLELVNSVDPSTRPVQADEPRLHRILMNLVGNAIKFTESGEVEITAKPVQPGPGDGQQGQIEVGVRDTGIGIPADQFDRIFGSFTQVDGTVAREYGGSGLGLAISKRLVNLHGGTIKVASEVGKGSVFSFTLAHSKKAVADRRGREITRIRAAAPDSGALIGAAPKLAADDGSDESVFRVLVVDDEAINLLVLVNVLTLQNHLVTKARDGFEALHAIEHSEQPFDLVVLDVMMPKMSGYEVCRTLRETHSLYELPVLMLTAKDQVTDLVAGFEAGANDYLAKPFDRRELLARARTLIMLRQLTRANDQLQEANELKAQLLRMAAHDLKGPLSSITGFTQIINREVASDPRLAKLAGKVLGASQQMLLLIHELLESARIESGKLVLKRVPVDVRVIAEQVVASFAKEAEDKQQSLELDAVEPGECMVVAEEARLEQVLSNLVSNAIKFSPRQGSIRVNIAPSAAGNSRPVARIEVADEGPGLNEEDKARLFRRFQRLSARPTAGEPSTGLGLSIAKQLVELHGGRIWAESETAQGSKFFVELPLADPDPAKPGSSRRSQS